MRPPGGAGLATVSSRSFLAGTQVMLHSFLAHNDWFDGPIAVFHHDLTPDERDGLEGCFPGLSCRRPPAALSDAVDALVAAHPHLANRRDRFLSLAAFAPGPGAGPVLFCDGDLLFRGDVGGLLASGADLVACPDGTALRGRRRARESFAEVAPGDPDALPRSFNAGLMAIGAGCLRDGTFERLLSRLDPDAWGAVRAAHTDQVVLNQELAGRVRLAGIEHNLLLAHRALSQAVEPVAVSEARVLHFNGPGKPWRPGRHRAAAERDPAFAGALRLWRDARLRFLSDAAPAAAPDPAP